MADFTYNSDLNGGSLMVRESRIVAGLLLKEVSPRDWHRAIQIENILQKRSLATAKRNAQAIRKRLELLTPDYLQLLRDKDDELATQVAFYAALARNQLLTKFVESIVRDAYLTGQHALAHYQWLDFLDDCALADTAINSWTVATKKKMGQVVMRMLHEAGYLQNTRNLTLQKVILRQELANLLLDHGAVHIKSCMEVALAPTSPPPPSSIPRRRGPSSFPPPPPWHLHQSIWQFKK